MKNIFPNQKIATDILQNYSIVLMYASKACGSSSEDFGKYISKMDANQSEKFAKALMIGANVIDKIISNAECATNNVGKHLTQVTKYHKC